jgi:protein gp37
MSTQSKIAWTNATWNPVAGCSKCSDGCRECYAVKHAHRMASNPNPKVNQAYTGLTTENGRNWTGLIRPLPERLVWPARWRKPRQVFVNSLSDLFHKDVPISFIEQVFGVMNELDHHVYQVLTKRSERLAELSAILPWAPHIWMGVSVESASTVHRADDLRATGAHLKFLSLEPLLGPIPDLNLAGINWVIVGGESGPRARPMDPDWVRDIRDQCNQAGVPFFFKQWGGRGRKSHDLPLLDGRAWQDMPQTERDRP